MPRRQIYSLIISDVPGDPLDIISSGPTVLDPSTPDDALAILDRYQSRAAGISPAVFAWLESQRTHKRAPPACRATNLVIGNNAVAVDAAGIEAERLGYSHAMISSRTWKARPTTSAGTWPRRRYGCVANRGRTA